MPANNRRNPFILAPALTLVVLVLLLLSGLFAPATAMGKFILCGTLTTVGFGVPMLFYLRVRGVSPISLFPFSRMRASHLRLALSCFFSLVFFDVLLRYAMIGQEPHYGVQTLYGFSVSAPKTLAQGAVAFLCVAVIPAFFEELLFRGALFYEYRPAGTAVAAILSSLLSACFGGSFPLFPVLLYRALFYALARYLTGNLWVPVLVHIGYGGFSLFFETYFALSAVSRESLPLYRLLLVAFLGISLFFLAHYAEGCLRERGGCGEAAPPSVPQKRRPLVYYDVLTAPSLTAVVFVFLIAAVIRLLV